MAVTTGRGIVGPSSRGCFGPSSRAVADCVDPASMVVASMEQRLMVQTQMDLGLLASSGGGT